MDVISNAVTSAIKEHFLESCLEPPFHDYFHSEEEKDGKNDISHEKESQLVNILALITQCWVHVKSETLADEFSHWLFGYNREPELNGVITHPLKHSLLRLCLQEGQSLKLEALSLFDVILERPCDPILQSLVLGSLCHRGYYNASLAESSINSWSDEEDERERSKNSASLEHLTPTRRQRQSSPMTALSRTLAPSNIARVINAWLYMVPDDLRTSDAAKDAGYEQYVKNAQVQVWTKIMHTYLAKNTWEKVRPLSCWSKDFSLICAIRPLDYLKKSNSLQKM